METLKRVYINGEADLPKEDGYYFCHYTGDYNESRYYTKNGVHYEDWLHLIDWYLAPLSREEIIQMLVNDPEIILEAPEGITHKFYELIADKLTGGNK